MSRRLAAALIGVSMLAAAAPGAAQAHGALQGPSAYGGPNPGSPEGLLPAPPADAPPGVCYAHVRVPGQTAAAPPIMGGAHWERRPPPPGAIGPVMCLVPDAPRAHVVVMPDREGWIRVACDTGRPAMAPPPPPPPCAPCATRRPVQLHDGWLSWPGKTYF